MPPVVGHMIAILLILTLVYYCIKNIRSSSCSGDCSSCSDAQLFRRFRQLSEDSASGRGPSADPGKYGPQTGGGTQEKGRGAFGQDTGMICIFSIRFGEGIPMRIH